MPKCCFLHQSDDRGKVKPKECVYAPETWNKNVNKRKTDSGEAYYSCSTKQDVAAKSIVEPFPCP